MIDNLLVHAIYRRRVWTGVIDTLLLFLIAAGIGNSVGLLGSGWSDFYVQIGLFWALNVAYHGVAELLFTGSLGKHLFGLRVVTVDRVRPRPRQLLVRNLCRVLDLLPNWYVLGFVALRADPARFQRLGDRLAGTGVSACNQG